MGLGKTLQTLTVILRQQPRINIHACSLIVVPSRAVGDQWAEEIRTKTEYGSVPYFVYQEDYASLIDRKSASIKIHFDWHFHFIEPHFRIIITTYDRVRLEYKKFINGDPNCPLYHIDWYRIVLDESHKVRALKTMLSDAVIELRGKFKWCLSGTPLQVKCDTY